MSNPDEKKGRPAIAATSGNALTAAQLVAPSTTAVLGYLVAKEFGFTTWTDDFHRACTDQAYSKRYVSAMIRNAVVKIHSLESYRRLHSALIKGIGWAELCEVLACSNRKRKRKTEVHRIPEESEIRIFVKAMCRIRGGNNRRSKTKSKSDQPSARWLRLLDRNLLSAAAAAEVIVAWRKARAKQPKEISRAGIIAREAKRRRRKSW